MEYIVDTMLGKLARHLRIFGYDTIYSTDLDDDRIIEMARGGRTIITRDRELVKRAHIKGLDALLIESTGLEQALAQMIEEGLVRKSDLRIGTRCSLCNSLLDKCDNGTWICVACGQRYWLGGHWRNISELMRRVGLLDCHE